MKEDVISRNLAIAYAKSGLVRRIDGEDWIRVSEVVQSLKDVPTVDIPCNDCCADTYRDGYEKGKADARPQGEWKFKKFDEKTGIPNSDWCPFCGMVKAQVYDNFCGNCGADMRGEEP